MEKIGTKGPFVRENEINAFARTPRRGNWKPFAIKLPFLISIVLLCLLCITFLEILLHKCMPLDKSVFDDIPKPDVSSSSANVLARTAMAPVPVLAVRSDMSMTSSVTSTTTASASIRSTSSISPSSTKSTTASTKPSTTTTSASVVSCTKTSTVYATVAVTVSGSVARTSIHSAPSAPCAVTSTMTMTMTQSAYLSLGSKPASTTASAYIILSSSLSRSTTTKSSTASTKPTTAASASTAVCSTTTTVYVTEALTVSGTVTRTSLQTKPSIPCAVTYTNTMIMTESAYIQLKSSISRPTTTMSTAANTKPSTAATSMSAIACTATTTVFVQVALTISGTVTYTSISRGPSVSCAVTSTVTMVKTESAYIQLTPSISHPTTTKFTTAGSLLSTPTTKSIPTSPSSAILDTSVHLVLSSGPRSPSQTVATTTTAVHLVFSSGPRSPSQTVATTSTAVYLQISSGPRSLSQPTTTTTSQAYITIAITKTQSSGYLIISSSIIPVTQHTTTSILTHSTTPGFHISTTSSGYLILLSSFTNSGGSRGLQATTPLPNSLGFSSMTTILTSDGQGTSSTILTTPTSSQDSPQSTDTSVLQQIKEIQRPNLLLRGDFTKARYFAAMFLPSILAIIIKIVWAITASGLKMMEPFYQLSGSDSASARKSLMDDHLGGTNSLNTFANALRGRILFITIVVVNLIADLLAPISAESMTVIPLSRYYDENGTLILYNPGWVLNRLFVRLLQGMLSFVVFVIVLIAILDHRRRSGVSANPSKIATMASLLSHPDMVQDLNQISPNASYEEIETSIERNRYRITAYGLVKIEEAIPQRMLRVAQDDASNPMRSAGPMSVDTSVGYRTKRVVWYRLVDGLLIFLLVGILATVIGYWLDGSGSGFNRFFNSAQFGPRFILSFSASITTTTFQSFEREVRLLTPYRLLAERNAPARDTVLRSVNGTEVTGLIQSFQHRALFPAFLALVTLLGNLLIVMIACVPFNEGVTFNAFTISSSFSVAVATIMLGAAIAVFYWRRKNKELNIPLEPNGSLIAMWMSLSNPRNQLRAIVNDSGSVSDASLTNTVMSDGRQYFAAWVPHEHGRMMWCVDTEYPFIQPDSNDNYVPPNGGAELENPTNPYIQATYQANRDRVSRRDDMSERLSLIRTQYGETPIQRREHTEFQEAPVGRRSHTEQVFPHIQTEYRDHPYAQGGGHEQRQSPSRSEYRDYPSVQGGEYELRYPHSRSDDRDYPSDRREHERRHPYSQSEYEESDISDRSNLAQAYPYLQAEYRRRSAGSRGDVEGTHLLQR